MKFFWSNLIWSSWVIAGEPTYEIVVCGMSAISFRPQCIEQNIYYQNQFCLYVLLYSIIETWYYLESRLPTGSSWINIEDTAWINNAGTYIGSNGISQQKR